MEDAWHFTYNNYQLDYQPRVSVNHLYNDHSYLPTLQSSHGYWSTAASHFPRKPKEQSANLLTFVDLVISVIEKWAKQN